MSLQPATLYIVATPIGNLDDISPRAISVLQKVAVIAAEDTRHSGRLLDRLDIKTRLISLHDHNEQGRTEQILTLLQQGKDVALIADAGTPLISDPGYHLVLTCHQAHITTVPIPGPSALIAALSVSGLAADRFVFEGFLAARAHARKAQMRALVNEPRTLIFYEAPHRLAAFIDDACAIFGGSRLVVVARELTKLHEEVIRDNLQRLQEKIKKGDLRLNGEFVLLLQGESKKKQDDQELVNMLKILHEKLSLKDTVDIAARISRCKRNSVYQLALETLRQKREGNGDTI